MITTEQAKQLPLEEFRDRLYTEEKILKTMKDLYQLRAEQEKEYVKCDYSESHQYRYRVLCGSLGLEGPWSEWIDGRPEKCHMNKEYQYRKINPVKYNYRNYNVEEVENAFDIMTKTKSDNQRRTTLVPYLLKLSDNDLIEVHWRLLNNYDCDMRNLCHPFVLNEMAQRFVKGVANG